MEVVPVNSTSLTSKSISVFHVPKNNFDSKGERNGGLMYSNKSKLEGYPCSLAFYVLPVFSFMYWTFLIPNNIRYDPVARKFVKQKSSFLRKIGCICQTISNLFYIIGGLNRFTKHDNENIIFSMYKMMFIIFMFLSISIFYTMWTKMDSIAEILTNVDEITTDFDSCGIHVAKSNSVKAMVWVALACHVILAIMYALLTYRQINVKDCTVLEVLARAMKESAISGIHVYAAVLGYSSDGIEIDKLPKALVIMMGVAVEVLEISNHFVWILTDLLVLLWGLMFRKMFQIFFLNKKTNRFLGGNLLQDIREFNSLSILLDKFNSVFGPVTFFITIAAIFHAAVSMGQIVTNVVDGLTSFVIILTFLPFFGMIFVASLVNDLANSFADFIKIQFNHQKGLNWSQTYGNSLEICQGLSMVYYDLQMNSVGFKGLGFFTISYSFVGTVFSVIATYAVVSLQFLINEKTTVHL